MTPAPARAGVWVRRKKRRRDDPGCVRDEARLDAGGCRGGRGGAGGAGPRGGGRRGGGRSRRVRLRRRRPRRCALHRPLARRRPRVPAPPCRDARADAGGSSLRTRAEDARARRRRIFAGPARPRACAGAVRAGARRHLRRRRRPGEAAVPVQQAAGVGRPRLGRDRSVGRRGRRPGTRAGAAYDCRVARVELTPGFEARHRSEVAIDLGAIRRNARTLLRALAGAELWAVVKANGYGHGAVDVGRAAHDAGATALCVATVAEALELREQLHEARLLVLGPADDGDLRQAQEARLELVVGDGRVPAGIRVHLKLDTGMGRWGLAELPAPGEQVVALMTHLATADSDEAFAREQIARFREATEPYAHLTRHVANSAAALRLPEARFDAARCGIALDGLSRFGEDAAADGLEPALSWTSGLAQVKRLAPGESTGYGRRFVADRETWIGIVPVGYADGFRRDLTGTN